MHLFFCIYDLKGISFLNYSFPFIEFYMQKETKSDGGDQEGQEVLHVRAYGSSFFTLGINIRCLPLTHAYGTIFISSACLLLGCLILPLCVEKLKQGHNKDFITFNFLFSFF